jgi:hypothetical protein
MQPVKSYFTKAGWRRDYRETIQHLEKLAARLVSYNTFSSPSSRSRWYHTNGYFRFKLNDVIKPKVPSAVSQNPDLKLKIVGFEYGESSPDNDIDLYLLETEIVGFNLHYMEGRGLFSGLQFLPV